MLTDQIADMFTRIRNAAKAGKRTVDIPASNFKKEITRILFENHFISKYAFVNDGGQGVIKILLKYDEQQRNAIQGLRKVSVPGRKRYAKADAVPRVLGGMGIALVSTSRGLMTDREARKLKIGGEIIGMIW
ncbi:MAG: 30S ribosomal protein S8 [Chitinispirillaceae bacterium]|nr:30S ribosomal protein S8 [Chitinispirillaceae bacterium]